MRRGEEEKKPQWFQIWDLYRSFSEWRGGKNGNEKVNVSAVETKTVSTEAITENNSAARRNTQIRTTTQQQDETPRYVRQLSSKTKHPDTYNISAARRNTQIRTTSQQQDETPRYVQHLSSKTKHPDTYDISAARRNTQIRTTSQQQDETPRYVQHLSSKTKHPDTYESPAQLPVHTDFSLWSTRYFLLFLKRSSAEHSGSHWVYASVHWQN